jgi:hypothetical protein
MGDASEVLRTVDAARESRAHFVPISFTDEDSAKAYFGMIRRVVKELPAAIAKAQRSRIERLIEALVLVA